MKFVRLLCLAVAAATFAIAPHAAGQRLYKEIIVFGHSAADNGNLHILTGGLVAAPPYFGGRFSNGPLWVEWLANRLGFPPPKETRYYPFPSEGGGTCYAYGGADTGYAPSQVCLGAGPGKVCALNVGHQMDALFAEGRTLDGDELIVIQAGANDSSAALAARNIGGHIATLAAAGGKTFLVPGESRLSQDPDNAGSPRYWDRFVADFNAELKKQLDVVEAQFNIALFRFNILALQDDMIASPAKYGLVNVTDPACPDCAPIPPPNAADTIVPNPDQYMYWDGAHFTAAVQKIIGDAAADLVLSPKAK